jgi:hypothetical protein
MRLYLCFFFFFAPIAVRDVSKRCPISLVTMSKSDRVQRRGGLVKLMFEKLHRAFASLDAFQRLV